jgi:hypothetical protein
VELAVGAVRSLAAEGYEAAIRRGDRFVAGESDEAALDAEDSLLAGALQRNLFGGTAPGDSQMAAMIGYLRRETKALARQDLAGLVEGVIAFGAPPVMTMQPSGRGDDHDRPPS